MLTRVVLPSAQTCPRCRAERGVPIQLSRILHGRKPLQVYISGSGKKRLSIWATLSLTTSSVLALLCLFSAEVYTGHWKDDIQHGQGSLKLCSGDMYTGEWADGLPHGQGRIEYANGDVFDGSFEQATISGGGVLQCKVSL